MFFYYIKIALKNLWNNKKYSAINIVGFSFSLSIFLVIILFILHEKSFDRYHQNSESIYRLIDEKENSSSIDYRVKDVLVEQFSEITNACLYQQIGALPIVYKQSGYTIKHISSVDKAFFEMFDAQFIKGNKNQPFNSLNSAVLTESNAQSLFGHEDPLGKELILRRMGNKYPLVVSAIIKDFPSNSSMDAGMMVNAENDDFKFHKYNASPNEERWPFRIYIQANAQYDPGTLQASINRHLDLLKPYVNEAGLIPLHDMYLLDKTNGSKTKRGNPSLIRLLLAIAFAILSLAIINYINLTLAQQKKRGKEIGVRKTIGASRKDLIIQFLLESVLVTFLAFGISLILFEVLSPFFHAAFHVPLSLAVLFTFPTSVLMFLSILSIGVLSGIWPALIFSSFNPVRILGKSALNKNRKNFSGNVLTVFQFTVSIALIFCVIVIRKQIEFAKHKDLGFNKDQLLRIDIPRMDKGERNNAIGMIDELRSLPFISNMTVSGSVPGKIKVQMGTGIEGKEKFISILPIDSVFLKTFDIEILQGRDFLPSDAGKACMINQTAMDYFGWESIENKKFAAWGCEVVGVVEDFHISSMHNAIEPVAIIYGLPGISQVSLKISGDNIGSTMDYLNKSWKKYLPEYPISYQFYDDWFNSMYEKEERFGRIISFFAILAISISCIGILGLAIFTSERRTKEIGIRKINGASTESIVFMLTREFTTWVLIAFVIAAPLAYLAINTWLEDFAYRTEISWWVFAVSGLSALFIAWGTVGWQSLKAALKNPVDALRYE